MVRFMESVSVEGGFTDARQQSGHTIAAAYQRVGADEIGEVGVARRQVAGDEDDLDCREFARQFVAGQPTALTGQIGLKDDQFRMHHAREPSHLRPRLSGVNVPAMAAEGPDDMGAVHEVSVGQNQARTELGGIYGRGVHGQLLLGTSGRGRRSSPYNDASPCQIVRSNLSNL